MTSSVYVKQRVADAQKWDFGDISDHYLRPWGECHPDYKAIPIDNPYGVKVCVKRHPEPTSPPVFNGYFRASPKLYEPITSQLEQRNSRSFTAKYVTQAGRNPQRYSDRRMPHEQDLLRSDYPKLDINYEGTGIRPLHAPNDEYGPYYQYGFSYTPHENSNPRSMEWHPRIATHPSQTVPPVKYDITRLQQPYPVWKDEHSYVGNSYALQYDSSNTKRIV